MVTAVQTRTQPISSIEREIRRCKASRLYFISEYCKIYDPVTKAWIPFRLWPAQVEALDIMEGNQLVVALKARQLGLSWLELANILYDMLFQPIATCLIFSRRDDESMYMLGHERLRGMYKNLPPWMQARKADMDNAHVFKLSNGSVARSFPTSGGDSYTATRVMVDEADLIPDLGKLLSSAKPTIDAGGKLHLISRVDKSAPMSDFKAIYRSAVAGENSYAPIFLPWNARPDRTPEWYETQRRDSISTTGSLDMLYEQYPETDTQALQPRSLDKRVPPQWVELCYDPLPILKGVGPSINGLHVFEEPMPGETYVIGIDPAEGNPNSDDSALCVLKRRGLEQVAELSGKFQPEVIAAHALTLAQWYNRAALMPERNNHGHAVILVFKNAEPKPDILGGHDSTRKNFKAGWNSSTLGKTILYDTLAEVFKNAETVVRSFKSKTQIESVEGSTMRAPEGMYDDCADAYALAVAGAVQMPHTTGEGFTFDFPWNL